MRVIAGHKLDRAVYRESPNQDARPDDTSIDIVVLHAISLPPGIYGKGHVASLFTNSLDFSLDESFESLKELRVSSHLLIERDGEITQFVPFNRRAWHAGVSSYNGRSNCNDFAIGIELEGSDSDVFTEIQYSTLATIIHALMKKYSGISYSRIVGHNEVAPDRKWDPGSGFEWSRFMDRLYSTVAEEYS